MKKQEYKQNRQDLIWPRKKNTEKLLTLRKTN